MLTLGRRPDCPRICTPSSQTTRYADLVAEDTAPALWDTGLRQQVYLGDEAFVERMLALANASKPASREVPKAQRIAPLALAQCLGRHPERATAMHAAYTQGGLTMTQIAADIGLSVSRISRMIAGVEAALRGAGTSAKA